MSMSTSQSASGPVQHGAHTDIARRARVRNLVHALQHALHAMPLYGVDSPATQRAIESLRETFRQVWTHTDSLTVSFTVHGVLVGDEEIAPTGKEAGRRREPLLQALHRDGIRELTFHRGFEADELDRFLSCVLQEHADEGAEDLVGALWDADFDRLDVHRDSGKQQVRMLQTGDWGGVSPQASAAAAGAPDDPPGLPEALLTQPLTGADLHVSDEEMRYLGQLLREEERRGVCLDVITALMDSLQDGDEAQRLEILEHLESLLPELLRDNRLEELVVVMQELRSFSEAAQNLGQSFCTAVHRLLGSFDRSSSLAAYLKDVEAGEIVPEQNALAELVACLGNARIASLVRIAERVKNKETTAILREACDVAVSRHPDLLVDLLRSEDEIVLRGAMFLITPTRGEDAVREVTRILRHPKPRMRLAAAKALMCVGSESALQALLRALEDDCEEVRQTSTWALATWKYRAALPAILAVLQGPRLKDMVLNEKLTYFDAYARLGEGRAVAWLDEVLNARHLFRMKHESDLRACAARALGQISAAEAQQALAKAKDDRDPKVRRIVQRHLRQGKQP
jgi:HEAT repeat protein